MTKVNTLVLQIALDAALPNDPAQHEVMKLVETFQDVFDTPDDADLWINLIEEELFEFNEELVNHGFSDNLIKEYCDVIYVLVGAINIAPLYTKENQEERVSNICSAIQNMSNIFLTYITTDIVLRGLRRVHASNMSKLTKEGEVLRREDGKTLKSDQYKPADMSGLIVIEHLLLELADRISE